VSAGSNPLPIPESEMDALVLLECSRQLEPWPYLATGEQVRITGGAFDGLNGILLESRKTTRVIVSVSLLQRSVAVEVDRRQVVRATRHSVKSIRNGLHGSSAVAV